MLTNSQRGVWSVTELGQTVKKIRFLQLHAEFVARTRKKGKTKKRRGKSDVESEIDQVEAEAEADWKNQLLDTLLKMSPHDGAEKSTREEYETETHSGTCGRCSARRTSQPPPDAFMSGNLCYQIEHRLFPDLPSNRYAEISERVKALCDKYDPP